MRRVFGVGVNDADYVVQPSIDGKRVWCPFYRKWHDLIKRCHCPKYLLKSPTYKDCVVCDEWITFSDFKTWMEKQDWRGNQLDKDILGDGKLYSSETCCFVPGWLNSLLPNSENSRGPYPLGVSLHKPNGRFRSHLSVRSEFRHLGYFDTPKEAHQAYLAARNKYVVQKMDHYPDERIRQAILRKIK